MKTTNQTINTKEHKSMKLVKLYSCFNMFYIDCNGWKELDDIIIFENGEIITRTNRGWFESSNNDIPELEFSCECVNKRKIDLHSKTAFLVRSNKDYHSDPAYALYVPQSVIQMKRSFGRKNFGDVYYSVEKFHSELFNKISCETWHSVGKLRAISDRVKETVQKANVAMGNLPQVAQTLWLAQREFDEEKARLDAMTNEELYAESQKYNK